MGLITGLPDENTSFIAEIIEYNMSKVPIFTFFMTQKEWFASAHMAFTNLFFMYHKNNLHSKDAIIVA